PIFVNPCRTRNLSRNPGLALVHFSSGPWLLSRGLNSWLSSKVEFSLILSSWIRLRWWPDHSSLLGLPRISIRAPLLD
ncbi:hypothetical protein LINPERHAP2_LOCUS28742, partial [Linum perenne]